MTKPRAKPGNEGKCGPNGCAVCRSDHRAAVDLALCYGQSARSVAEQFGFSYDSVLRHSKRHLTASQRAALLTASRPSEIDVQKLSESESQGLLAHLVAMRARLQSHSQACAAQGNYRGSILAERVHLASLELGAKLVGSLIARSEVVTKSFLVSPDYLRLRTILIQELKPYPELAQRIAARLGELESEAAAEITSRSAKSVLIEHAGVE
jgi:hypothetical protein